MTEIEELVERVDELEARLDEERARREELEAENEELRGRVDELEADLEKLRTKAGESRAELRQRVNTLEESDGDESESSVSVDVTPTPDGREPGAHEPKTALEDVAALPEPVVEESLKANQQRARSVAVDIVDYAQSVPAGYSLTSSALRQVLTAQKDEPGKAYTQTVGRVIEYLDDLGEDAVEVKETRGGQRTVVFDDDLVKRLVAIRNANHEVVTGDPVAG